MIQVNIKHSHKFPTGHAHLSWPEHSRSILLHTILYEVLKISVIQSDIRATPENRLRSTDVPIQSAKTSENSETKGKLPIEKLMDVKILIHVEHP